MNLGDTELMLGRLERAGHEITEDFDAADMVLVNTCAVKGPTMNRVLYRLKELKQENKKILVAGCLPLINLEAIKRIGPFEGIISCQSTDSIDEVVEKIDQNASEIRALLGDSKKIGAPRFKSSEVSAPVAIAEGCMSKCSYCCVKFARGRLRSFDSKEIAEEIRNLVQSGRREILLTAQDTAAYGIGSNVQLPQLLEKISLINKNFKVRVGMMNPALAKKLLPELVEAFDDPKIYNFLHLPVQSGNDEVLNRMRRGYSVEEFIDIVKTFKSRFSDLYLSTDIIAGFPEESEEDFEDSCELIERVKPDKVNLTRFTPMPGTDAKEMKQISGKEKKRRSKKLSQIHRRISYEKNLSYVGRTMDGLVTKKGKKGGYVVRLSNYKPAIVKKAVPGDFVRVRLTEARPTYLMGKVKRGSSN